MMQFLKINRKIIIIVSIIILIIALLIFPITIIVIFLGDGLKENIIDKKAMEYESKEKRLEYFQENEEYLNELVNYFIEYPELDRIGKNIWCSNANDHKYDYHGIEVCTSKKIENLPIKDIVETFVKTNLSIVGRRNDYIAFYLYITTYYDVYYNYYFISSKNEYIKYDYGIIEENIINENWSSVFSNIPYD